MQGVIHGCEKFFRSGYVANLMSSWIPSLEGVKAKLETGATVADVGLREGRVDAADGEGVSEVDVLRVRLSRWVD